MRRRSGVPAEQQRDETEVTPQAAAPRLGPRSLPYLQRAAGNAAVAGLIKSRTPVPVQRNVGIELEEPTWKVAHADSRTPVSKATPIVDRPLFQLQAEYNGPASSIELVTNAPGTADRSEWDQMVSGMQQLGNELRQRPRTNWFPAAGLTGGAPGYDLYAGGPFRPKIQLTAGVPLAAIPTLLARLDAMKSGFQVTVPGTDVVNGIVAAFRRSSRTAPADRSGGEHAELIGFVTMVRAFLQDAAAKSGKDLLFLKQIPPMMARTDFAAMFMMLDESDRKVIAANQQAWVKALTTGLDGGGNGSLAGNTVYDPGNPAVPRRLGAKRVQWLTTMVSVETGPDARAGRDLLSKRGRLAGPDPIGTADGDDVVNARKLGAGMTEAGGHQKGSAVPRDPSEYQSVVARIERSKSSVAEVAKVLAELEDFYLGLGGLGAKADFVDYRGAAGTPAVIVEFRKPKGTEDWATTQAVYSVIEQVIAGPEQQQTGPADGGLKRLWNKMVAALGSATS